MEVKLRNELQATSQYCKELETNFQNNIEVIQERQAQIEALGHQIQQLQQENEIITANIQQLREKMNIEVSVLNDDYNRKLEEKQKQMEQLAVRIEIRLRKQFQKVGNRYNNETEILKKELTLAKQSYQRVINENRMQKEVIRDQKDRLIDLQARLDSLTNEKNHYSNKMEMHIQELDSLKNSQQQWEETLRNKLKESQIDKQQLQQELSQVKLAFKQKIKKQKEQFAKKLIQLGDEKELQMREASTSQKQTRYRLQKALNQHKQMQNELERLREENKKNDCLINKYKQSEMKSNFEKNQKQFEMLQKMFDQNARDLKLQIETLTQQKKSIKEQLDEANSKRESVEKAVERLKVQLVNKSKQVDELKKQNRKMRHQTQIRIKQYNMQPNIGGYPSRQIQNPSQKKYEKLDIVESVKLDGQYSKVFTDDMDYEKFFEASSPLRSPKHGGKQIQMQNSATNRQTHLLKRISQLQLQNQEYKTLIKSLREEAQNMRRLCQQDKVRQISVYRDKANMYWEKANDREQQLVALKQQITELRNTYNILVTQHKLCSNNQQQLRKIQEEERLLKQKLSKLEKQNKDLQDEVGMLENQRNMLEDISAQLRSQIHSLKELVNTNFQYGEQEQSQKYSHYHPAECPQYNQHYNIQSQNASQLPRHSQIQFQQQSQQLTRPKIPKKLHDLVRQKKTLSISGRRANISEKAGDVRLQHVGTDSQKQVYEKMKVKNKTPPKVVNYADLKEKRSSQLETPSQREVFERLKSRQTAQVASPERGPQAGINYLQLRSKNNIEE